MTDQEIARAVEAAAAALTDAIATARKAGLVVDIDTSLTITDCDQPDIGPLPLIQVYVARPVRTGAA